MALTFSPFGLVGAYHPSGIDRPRTITPVRVGSRTSVTYSLGDLYKNDAVGIDGAGSASGTGFPTKAVIGANSFPAIGTFLGVEYTEQTTGRRAVSPYLANNTVLFDPVFYINADANMVYEAQLAASDNTSVASGNFLVGDFVYVTNATVPGFPIIAGAGTGLSRQFVSTTAPATNPVNAQLVVVDQGWDNVDSDPWNVAAGTNLFPTVRVKFSNVFSN